MKLLMPFFSWIFLVFCSSLFGQIIPSKFGKPNDKYVKMTDCPIDSSAEAFIIFDEGTTYMDLADRGWIWRTSRHSLIKIVNKSGFEWANFEIPIYGVKENKEIVSGIKGFIYNYEDGRVQKYKLEKSHIKVDTIIENQDKVKISFPNVKEGSLIELSYLIESGFFTYLRSWQFQHAIPVLQSHYTILIPEYFKYLHNLKGHESLLKDDKRSQDGILNTSHMQGGTLTSLTYHYTNAVREMTAINLPALKNEPYVNSLDNYRLAIDFELMSVHFPGSEVTEYTTSWDRVDERFLLSDNFGKQLNEDIFPKEYISDILDNYTSPEMIMQMIYEKVKKEIKWNGKYGVYINQPIAKVYKNGTGNPSEINFILINLLRSAEIEAYPVILSSRTNGMIYPAFPAMDIFNYMIAVAYIDNKTYLLDATDRYSPVGILPIRSLNGLGRVVDPNKSGWIDLTMNTPFEEIVQYDLEMANSTDFNGKLSFSHLGYAAYEIRNKMDGSVTDEKYLESIDLKSNSLVTKNIHITGLNDIYKPVLGEMDVEIREATQVKEDLIVINPFFYERMIENPFKKESREFPVDFAYPIKRKIIVKLGLPEGIEVESLPENESFTLPEDGGSFSYNISQNGRIIQLEVVIDVAKSIYLPDEYNSLKTFYSIIISKQSEQIILKRL